MAKKEAPAKLTGGAGFNYEDRVAGQFLVEMLAGICFFGDEFGRIVRLDWQARDTGRLLDDLSVKMESLAGEHIAEISIKSDRQVTTKGFPASFVEAAWEEWLGTETAQFRKERDLLVLVTGKLADSVADAWEKTLREALKSSSERMLSRLAPAPSESKRPLANRTQRSLFASLRCPVTLEVAGKTDDIATVDLLRRIRLLHFDFQAQPSPHETTVLARCRELLHSSDRGEARELWHAIVRLAAENRETGGSVDLPRLLAELRSRFRLRGHPDYRADWEALSRSTSEALTGIRADIGGRETLKRDDVVNQVAGVLKERRFCLAVGESGCGKSAVAKMLGHQKYARTIAFLDEAFETGRAHEFEHSLNLAHPVTEILAASCDECLVIFDSIERFSDKGLALAGRLMAELAEDTRYHHIHVILTAQIEAAGSVLERLSEAGVPRSLLVVTPIDVPKEGDVRKMVAKFPALAWSTLHVDLQPLLRNLKVLDWVVRASQCGGNVVAARVAGLPELIDYLWERWVETGNSAFGRSGLLKRLATVETESLGVGVPLTHLDHAEQLSLSELAGSELLRVKDERVRFAHDLLGDWSRLKVLVGEDPTLSAASRRRASAPRWHRSVRLFGRWLIASPDGIENWKRAMERSDDGSDDGIVVRDLLLESVIFTENSQRVLNQAWPVLVANEGALLKRLLDRFLFVATIPDARFRSAIGDGSLTLQSDVAFRMPFWPYWGALLLTLEQRTEDVLHFAPYDAAKICRMWLDKLPAQIAPGVQFPWRGPASRIAHSIAREMQGRRSEGHYFEDDDDRIAYEAALFASPDLPDDISQLALELAHRRPISQQIQERADKARREAELARRKAEAENPEQFERYRKMATRSRSMSRGPLHDPWPDGPRSRIEKTFSAAILDSHAILALASARPEVAIEVLLAVCIENPQHEDLLGGSRRHDRYSLEFWNSGWPPLYFRGPFLQLLRQIPASGVDVAIRLVNFATSRWADAQPRRRARLGTDLPSADDLTVSVHCETGTREWRGDSVVYRWHLDAHVESRVLSCVLMALEKWLYEEADSGKDIGRWCNEIIERSQSVAFAGLLANVGKKYPHLFAAELRPILGTWAFHVWEQNILVERRATPAWSISWWQQPRELTRLAREWHTFEHRRRDLTLIACYLLFNVPSMASFFDACVERWQRDVMEAREPRSLEILIERLRRANYRKVTTEEGSVHYEFVPPTSLAERIERDSQSADNEMLLMTFPMTCRQLLDGARSMAAADVDGFWETLQLIASRDQTDPEFPSQLADALTGGIAVLLILQREWLVRDPEKHAWCVSQLSRVAQQPPDRAQFDCPEAVGEHTWDYFLAEAGVALLEASPEDEFARMLVALGICGFHYGTTRRTMRRAFACRNALGALFTAMQHFAVRWSMIRRLRVRSEQILSQFEEAVPEQADTTESVPAAHEVSAAAERWRSEHNDLVTHFRRGHIDAISVEEASVASLRELHRVDDIAFPERRHRIQDPDLVSSYWRPPRREDTGLELAVLQAAFDWLDSVAAVSPAERNGFLCTIQDLLSLSLTTLPVPEELAGESTDGIPTDFDGWLYRIISRAIVRTTDSEKRSRLWKPIVGLGAHCHNWVERFFWYWFSDGVDAASSPATFMCCWIEMLRFAMASPGWDRNASRSIDLDDMVFELLGYHWGAQSIGVDERFTPLLGEYSAIFGQAADRWFSMGRVANGFAQVVVKPAYDRVLCSGVKWLSRAIAVADDRFWRASDIESHLVEVLRHCLERHQSAVEGDLELRSAFMDILTALSSRGSHGAMALRDRLLDSLSRR